MQAVCACQVYVCDLSIHVQVIQIIRKCIETVCICRFWIRHLKARNHRQSQLIRMSSIKRLRMCVLDRVFSKEMDRFEALDHT